MQRSHFIKKMTILPELTTIILGFLLGSISSAIIVCKLMHLPDPRNLGSQNPGATNVLRIGGKKPALVVLILDLLKGFIPVALSLFFGFSLFASSLVAMSVFLGHIYPIWFSFKGGKGVATFVGTILALNFISGLLLALIWLFIAKVLKISSLSALITVALSSVIFYYFTNNAPSSFVVITMSLWVFWTHRGNISRLLNKKEDKVN